MKLTSRNPKVGDRFRSVEGGWVVEVADIYVSTNPIVEEYALLFYAGNEGEYGYTYEIPAVLLWSDYEFVNYSGFVVHYRETGEEYYHGRVPYVFETREEAERHANVCNASPLSNPGVVNFYVEEWENSV